MKATPIGIVCFAVVCVTLTLGLWPFHAPKNQVTWLPNRNGVRIGHHGTLSTPAVTDHAAPLHRSAATAEVWLQVGRIWESGTVMAFYDPQVPLLLDLRQSQLDLKLQVQANRERAAFYVDDVFHINYKSRPVFLAITSDGRNTAVYVNGRLARTVPGFPFSAGTLAGRLILGTSAWQNDDWTGQVFGLALYGRALASPEVSRHYRSWTQQGKPEIAANETCLALYMFDEHSGTVVHNRIGTGPDLDIPPHYEVPDQIFLEPVWKEFELSRSYAGAAVKNIVGLVPFGFCFYAWFLAFRVKRAALLAVLSGTLVSLTIEVLQGFLPTRDSGTTDLITNTIGAWIGVGTYRLLAPTLMGLFPGLSLPKPHE
jgi:hypothetical protein